MTHESPASTIAHCRGCGYLLRGLASTGACPECGRSFDLADAKTWTRHPRRGRIWRWLRWPLAILLLLVFACACGIGWLYGGWRQEQPAIAWARAQDLYWRSSIDIRQIGPQWLQERAGRWGWLLERAQVLKVTLDESPEARELLRRLRWLESVRVEGPGLTGEWIGELGARHELTRLGLCSKGVNDASLTRLGSQKKLEMLNLYASEVTDAGLAALAGFPELRELYLYDTPVKGPGLQHLRHVPKLNILALSGTMVGDDAMPEVAKCAELRDLWLGTRVTSRGVRELAGLKNLEELNLSKTQVDDSVVETLAMMPSLKKLFLHGLSPETRERLRAALPAVTIYPPQH